METFNSLLQQAETMRRLESDPIRSDWWAGYIQGLRRAHHGAEFGNPGEHEWWLAAVDSNDPSRAALGRGYRAGLTLEMHEPA